MMHPRCLSLPASRKIHQDQRRKIHVANIQDGLHGRMENVQVVLYFLAVSDEVLVPCL